MTYISGLAELADDAYAEVANVGWVISTCNSINPVTKIICLLSIRITNATL